MNQSNVRYYEPDWIPPPDDHCLYKPWNNDTIVLYIMVGPRRVGKTTLAYELKTLFERNFKINTYIFNNLPFDITFYHLRNLLIFLRKGFCYASTTFIIIDQNMFDNSARLAIITLCHIFMVHVAQLFLICDVSEIFVRNNPAIQSGTVTPHLLLDDISKSSLPDTHMSHETRIIIPANYKIDEYNVYLTIIEVSKKLVLEGFFTTFTEEYAANFIRSGQTIDQCYLSMLFFPFLCPQRNFNMRRLGHGLIFDYFNANQAAASNFQKICCQQHLLFFTDGYLMNIPSCPTYEDMEFFYNKFMIDVHEFQQKTVLDGITQESGNATTEEIKPEEPKNNPAPTNNNTESPPKPKPTIEEMLFHCTPWSINPEEPPAEKIRHFTPWSVHVDDPTPDVVKSWFSKPSTSTGEPQKENNNKSENNHGWAPWPNTGLFNNPTFEKPENYERGRRLFYSDAPQPTQGKSKPQEINNAGASKNEAKPDEQEEEGATDRPPKNRRRPPFRAPRFANRRHQNQHIRSNANGNYRESGDNHRK